MTTFGDKAEGDDALNIEIERSTQVFVDTVRSGHRRTPGTAAAPARKPCCAQQGTSLDDLAAPATLPRT
jgi:riboflavin synthase